MDALDRERIAKALADPSRWRIILFVRENPGCPCHELVAHLGLSQPTVSHHVAALCAAGILSVSREGCSSRLKVESAALEGFSRELILLSR